MYLMLCSISNGSFVVSSLFYLPGILLAFILLVALGPSFVCIDEPDTTAVIS